MSNSTWDDKVRAFEAWKCHTGIGGDDKNWMIQIVTWLLGFSSAILAYAATAKQLQSLQHVFLAVLGIGISLLGVLVAILYGGYAARNWSIADRIADAYGLEEQRCTYCPYEDKPASWSVTGLARRIAKPCGGSVAPVFRFYIIASLAFLIAHLILLILVLTNGWGTATPAG